MIHPSTEVRFISDMIGHGVFARTLIPAGTITWALDDLDREYTPYQVKAMDPITQNSFLRYTYRNKRGNYVLLWDHTRYMNHSFNPNCMATAYNFEVAIRDIQPGEQLTNDYGTLNIVEPFEPAHEGIGRRIVTPDDLDIYYQQWDDQVVNVLPQIIEVYQPLGSLLSHETWKTLAEAAKGNIKLQSIRYNFCGRDFFE